MGAGPHGQCLEVLHDLHRRVAAQPRGVPQPLGEWRRGAVASQVGQVVLQRGPPLRVLPIDKPAVFPVTRDRPILFSALATADVLLTLDRVDFSRLLGTRFYGLAIMTPGTWLVQEREVRRPDAS